MKVRNALTGRVKEIRTPGGKKKKKTAPTPAPAASKPKGEGKGTQAG